MCPLPPLHMQVVIAFRGTKSLANVKADLQVRRGP